MTTVTFKALLDRNYRITNDQKHGYVEDFKVDVYMDHGFVYSNTTLLASNENLFDRHYDDWKNQNIVLYYLEGRRI